VIERTHEIGPLRALGFTRAQVRAMIVRGPQRSPAQPSRWASASGCGSDRRGHKALVGFQTPGLVCGVPWAVLATIAVATVLLVLVASLAPARRAVRVTPVEALRS
jgi:putative ABC transport system permease protein